MSKNKKKRGQAIVFVIPVLIGFVCGILMFEFMDKFYDSNSSEHSFLSYLLIFLLIDVSAFLQIIIHEAGHLIFGLISGYKFSSFRIMNIALVRQNGKFRLKKLSLAGTGGQCLLIPPELKDGKIPVMLYNLGGSVLNIFAGIIFLVLFFVTKDNMVLSASMLFASVIGFVFALLNGIPMHLGGVDNDGYNAFSLSDNPDALRAMWIQLMGNAQSIDGVPVRDMPSCWFEMPSDDKMKNNMVASLGALVCNRLLDEHKFEQADAAISHLLEIDSGLIGLNRNLLVCDRLFIELITENRPEIINELLTKEQKKFMKSMKDYPSVLRTRYALALLFEKDSVKAEKIKERFDKVSKSYTNPGEIRTETELISLLKGL